MSRRCARSRPPGMTDLDCSPAFIPCTDASNRENTPMASIHKDISIDAPAETVWDAVRDFGALHRRLVPGFVLDTKIDGEARIVTLANGTVARELLVDCDEARRRLVYAVV